MASNNDINCSTYSFNSATTITSGTAFTVTSGDMLLSNGRVTLPRSTTLVGNILINSVLWMHNRGATSSISIGPRSGILQTLATNNVSIGNEAGGNVSGGDDLVNIGYRAGYSGDQPYAISIGNTIQGVPYCVLIGKGAAGLITSSNKSVAIGHLCLDGGTGSYDRVCIGYLADHLSYEDGQACIGYRAMSGASQAYCVSIGASSMQVGDANNSASCTAIGYKANYY